MVLAFTPLNVKDKPQGLSPLYTLRVVTTCHSPRLCDMTLGEIAFFAATMLKNRVQASHFATSESLSVR
jgi:hypothetical protein